MKTRRTECFTLLAFAHQRRRLDWNKKPSPLLQMSNAPIADENRFRVGDSQPQLIRKGVEAPFYATNIRKRDHCGGL